MGRQTELERSGVWRGLSAVAYDEAVYGSPLLAPVLQAELRVARKLLTPDSVLVEVGCGTGQFCRRLVGETGLVVGVDISAGMLAELTRCAGDGVVAVEGDACRLADLVAQSPCVETLIERGSPVVAACVMNTLGIMDDMTRRRVLQQMAVTVGPAGRVFGVVFDGAHFERGIEEFYWVNPGLCGDLTEATIDLVTNELTVPSTGYYSHWFSVDELLATADEAGLQNVAVATEGLGLFLVAAGR